MAIVDERGRLFGRWNLLDLALLVLLLGLIPLGYAAFVLFRAQPPRLLSVEPTQMQQSDSFTLRITGEHFRPYMRLSIGTQQGREFLFKSTGEAEVPFAAVPPGRYDVVLFDQAQERSRLPGALTISPSNLPSSQIVAVGTFGNLDEARAAKLTAGTKLDAGEIVAVGKPIPDLTEVLSGSKMIGVPVTGALRLPAVIKFNCDIRVQGGTALCTVKDVIVAPKNLMLLPTPLGVTPFQVLRTRSPHPLQAATVTIRVSGQPALLSRIKAGDVDRGGVDSDVDTLATIERVSAVRPAELEITLRANLQLINEVWSYDSMPLRFGSPFPFRTTGYDVTGVVTDIVVPRE
jgi:hypothetical protein